MDRGSGLRLPILLGHKGADQLWTQKGEPSYDFTSS